MAERHSEKRVQVSEANGHAWRFATKEPQKAGRKALLFGARDCESKSWEQVRGDTSSGQGSEQGRDSCRAKRRAAGPG